MGRSEAATRHDERVGDVDRLIAIHKELGGDKQGKRVGLEPLNRSGIVLMTAVWEAYCEGIVAEGLDHLVEHLPDASTLPKKLKRLVAKELEEDVNQIAVWQLADGGWRSYLQARLSDLADERAQGWNTPKSGQVRDFFSDYLGVPDVTSA